MPTATHRSSLLSLFLCSAIVLGVHFFYYPKWKKNGTEATISWDASGYYMYLPATFIYKDLKSCSFQDEILSKYKPTPDFQQAFVHKESGNYVMKYSLGQALQYSPFFFIAHAWAMKSSQYEADGFSHPYQFMISMGSLIIFFIGLVFIRKALLYYFSDRATALTLLGIALGSNYLNYTAIDGAMTHNTVFTLYALLIFSTIKFYERQTLLRAAAIGLLIGLASLTRPTEIISILIPLLWGLKSIGKESLLQRWQFLKKNSSHLMTAMATCAAIGSLQLIYWKYATGDWLVYSYEDQGFSWLSPHIIKGIFSYRSGWLMYSPFMIFSLIGFYFLYKQKRALFAATSAFAVLFIYIAFAWDIWWYGGSLGQRTMVQSYAVLAFPLTAFMTYWLKAKWLPKTILGLIMALFIYVNLWYTHQAHLGSMFYTAQISKAYYWNTILRNKNHPEYVKLLDGVDHIYKGDPKNKNIVYRESVNLILNGENQNSAKISIQAAEFPESYDWIRAQADVTIGPKEWNHWQMTQFIVEFYNQGSKIDGHMIRVQRLLRSNSSETVYMDIPKPSKDWEEMKLFFWHANGQKELKIKDIAVYTFEEE